MNKNERRKMIWQALYKPVQEPEAKKEMIYDAPQAIMCLLRKVVNIVASP